MKSQYLLFLFLLIFFVKSFSMEWAEDYKETEPHQSHVSHLFGLYPGNQITVVGTPELAEAARKTLEAHGDDGTGPVRTAYSSLHH